MLAIWGDRDVIVPVEKSVDVFNQTLKQAGNLDYTLKVFPNADHGLRPPPEERTSEGEFISGYLETITGWVLERVNLAS